MYNINIDIFKILSRIFFLDKSQESNYLLKILVEEEYINSDITTVKNNMYFIPNISALKNFKMQKFGNYSLSISNKFYKEIKFSCKNGEHYYYLYEGFNPSNITKIIRKDKIEKLQELSAQANFDFNQIIEPSIYDRCSFVNHKNVTLIDYAAYFGSIKCFKYLLLNGADLTNTGKYAVAGGNFEIIHICRQSNSSFNGSYEAAIKFHRNDIFFYIYENKIVDVKDINKLGKKCVQHYNFEILEFLIEEGLIIDDSIIIQLVRNGNTKLALSFLEGRDQVPTSILFLSTVSRNFELVESVLQFKGININMKNKMGKTPLIYASEYGLTEIVNVLLEHEEIDVNIKDKEGQTALLIASNKNFDEIVKLLLENEKIDVNVTDKNMNDALLYGSKNGNDKIVKMLLKCKEIDVNHQNEAGKTSLILSSEKNYKEIVKLLLERKEININAIDFNGQTALMHASKKGNIEIVKMLLSQEDINIDAKNFEEETAVNVATVNDQIEVAEFIIEKKLSKIEERDNYENAKLLDVFQNGTIKSFCLQFEQGNIDFNDNDLKDKITLIAFTEGFVEVAKKILEIENKNFDGDLKGELFIAVSESNIKEIVKVFLKQKIIKLYESSFNNKSQKEIEIINQLILEQNEKDLDVKNKNLQIKDIQNKLIDFVVIFLEHNGIKTSSKKEKEELFISACENCYTAIIEYFFKQKGIDFNAKNDSGSSALQLLSKYGQTKYVKFLLEQEGIDVNIKNNYDVTPLISASENGRVDVVKMLLKEDKIDINAKDDDGATALMLASYHGIKKLLNYFLNKKKLISMQRMIMEIQHS